MQVDLKTRSHFSNFANILTDQMKAKESSLKFIFLSLSTSSHVYAVRSSSICPPTAFKV